MRKFSGTITSWGIVRLASVGGDEIPEMDPESGVGATSTSILLGVVDPDVSEIKITVIEGEESWEKGAADMQFLFDGVLEAPYGEIEITDILAEDFCQKFTVAGGATNVRVFVDEPLEATVMRVYLTEVKAPEGGEN